MGLALSVAKSVTKKVRRSDVMSPLQSRLLGDIERALVERKITKTELAKAGGPSQQVLEKWSRGTSPTLRKLEGLAEALSTEVILVIPGVSDPPASISEHIGGHAMTEHDQELARLIERMDDGERRELLGYLKGKAMNRPLDPVVERGPGRGRSSVSSGQTT